MGGSDDKRFSHCLIAGIDRPPRKVTRGMSKQKIEKRSRSIKPFVKYINVRHIFPTRYVVDMDLKKAVDEADLVDEKKKVDVKRCLRIGTSTKRQLQVRRRLQDHLISLRNLVSKL